jgi:hypothetical protein
VDYPLIRLASRAAFIQLTKLWPLRLAEVIERDGNV